MIDLNQNSITARAWIKQLPCGTKICLLFIFSSCMLFLSNLNLIAIAFLFIVLAYLCAGFSLKYPIKMLMRYYWIFIILFLVQWINNPWIDSFAITLRLATLFLAANLITVTTKASDMLDTFQRFFTLFKPIGVNPEKIALALSLTLRFVPVIKTIYDEIVEVQKARGLERSFLALFVPLIIRIFKMGEDVAQAIEARSYENDEKI